MEPRFGHSFEDVRIHQGAEASKSADLIGALAYTAGRDIVFGAGQYSLETTRGQETLAHELTHVLQQNTTSAGVVNRIGRVGDPQEIQADSMAAAILRDGNRQKQGEVSSGGDSSIRRLVRRSEVNCLDAAGNFRNPFGADRKASEILGAAVVAIDDAQAERVVDPGSPKVILVGNSLKKVFGLDPGVESTWTAGPPSVSLPVIRRRLEAAKNYIDSVVFSVNCVDNGVAQPIAPCDGNCDVNIEAYSCHSNPTGIVLCPLFWSRNSNQRGRTWAHEVFHITFRIIDDWTAPNAHNAHCYAQFTALLNGFNSPAGYTCG
jgi:hypothetical protein